MQKARFPHAGRKKRALGGIWRPAGRTARRRMLKGRLPRAVTVLAAALALVGLGLMLYPEASNLFHVWRFREEIREYDRHVGVDSQALFAQAEAYNQALAQREEQFATTQEEWEYVSTLLDPLGSGMMGYLEIPKIDVSLPIYPGTEDSALQDGAGWWFGSSLPTGGPGTHCILTAHTGLVSAKLFTDLDQMEIGDTFTLFILDRVLTYQVDQILVTEPEETAPLRIVEGEDYVTLYTCTPYGVNTHRLLVRGSRIETPETPAAGVPLWREAAPLLGAVLLLALAVLLVLAVRSRRPPGRGKTTESKRTSIRGERSNDRNEKKTGASPCAVHPAVPSAAVHPGSGGGERLADRPLRP